MSSLGEPFQVLHVVSASKNRTWYFETCKEAMVKYNELENSDWHMTHGRITVKDLRTGTIYADSNPPKRRGKR